MQLDFQKIEDLAIIKQYIEKTGYLTADEFNIIAYVLLDNPWDYRHLLYGELANSILKLSDPIPECNLYSAKDNDREISKIMQYGIVSTSTSVNYCTDHIVENYSGFGELYQIDKNEIIACLNVESFFSQRLVKLTDLLNELNIKGVSLYRTTSEHEYIIYTKSQKIYSNSLNWLSFDQTIFDK